MRREGNVIPAAGICISAASGVITKVREPGLLLYLSLVDIPSHLDDLPPTMMKKEYANVPIINRYDTAKRHG